MNAPLSETTVRCARALSGDRDSSGIAWFGDVPEGWEVRKTKFLWREVANLSPKGAERLLSVSQYDGIKPASESSRSESLEGYKIVEKGDLVINIMLAWMGGLGVSDFDGIVSPAYAVYKPIVELEPRYLHYLYRTPLYLTEFAKHSTGVIPSRWRMYSDDFGQVLTVLPPLPEQRRIVARLDEETGTIDRAIAAEEKTILLLQERRQIVINEVIGGNTLEKIQNGRNCKGWESKRGKFFLTIVSGYPFDSARFTTDCTGMPLVRIRDITTEQTEVFFKGAFPQEALIDHDDILIGMDGDFNVAKWKGGKALLNQRVCRIAKVKNANPDFVFHQLGIVLKRVNALTYGTTVKHLSVFDIYDARISLPSIPEQEAIVAKLDEATGKIDRALAAKKRQIELLRERKQIMVEAAVTGRKVLK